MNPAQIHLALNHLPIFATLFGAGLVALGLLKKEEGLRKVGLWFLVIAALSTVPVYLTGEPAEELVEHRAGVSEQVIHAHEEAAELALIVVGVLGAASLFALLWSKLGRPLPVASFPVLLAISLVTFGLFIRTAHLGGQIRHDEISSGQTVSAQSEGKEKEEDD